MLCQVSNFNHVSLSVCLSPSVSVSQLISSDADGAIQRAGRFRVENGSSDEVYEIWKTFQLLSQTSGQNITFDSRCGSKIIPQVQNRSYEFYSPNSRDRNSYGGCKDLSAGQLTEQGFYPQTKSKNRDKRFRKSQSNNDIASQYKWCVSIAKREQ